MTRQPNQETFGQRQGLAPLGQVGQRRGQVAGSSYRAWLLGLGMVVLGVGSFPWAKSVAQGANFERLDLQPGFAPATGVATGFTGGSYSLSALANRDRAGNPCLGYGDQKPDFVIDLKQTFARLSIGVDSKGKDTTLVIQGPNGFRCADDGSKGGSDAEITAENWERGPYRVWVGTIDPGQRHGYRLIIKE